VLNTLKRLHRLEGTSRSASNSSFLLEENDFIPVTLENISQDMADTDVPRMLYDLQAPAKLRESPAFAFLWDNTHESIV